MYNAPDQVTVLIVGLLHTLSSKEMPFLNVITREQLTFLVVCLVTHQLRFKRW